MILYGIKNCDTVKKARRFLDDKSMTYTFHDMRVDGLDKATIGAWLETVSWEVLLNKRSTTWRNIAQEQKDSISQDSAIELMLESPTLIKRPVLVTDNKVLVGLNENNYQELIK